MEINPILTIGIPCLNDMMHVQTTASLVKIISALPFPRHISFVNNTLLHTARRQIVLEAQKYKATHLLFLDTDMEVEGDTVLKLMAHGKEVIGVNYYQRGLPLISTVRMKTPETGLHTVAKVPDTLFECDAVGSGCMLVDMRVFDIIEKPWFFYKYDESYPTGEDVWFCEQVKKAGLHIWCDPTIPVGHIGEYKY